MSNEVLRSLQAEADRQRAACRAQTQAQVSSSGLRRVRSPVLLRLGGYVMADKLHRIEDDFYVFHCPGCGYGHGVTVNGKRNSQGASWGWNGSLASPTFTPSINCNAGDPLHCCHSFVRDGKIQFLGDSFHALKGQTVDIPDWES